MTNSLTRSKIQADVQSNRDYMRDSVVIGSAQCQAGVSEIAEGVADALYLALVTDGSDSVQVNGKGYVMVLTRKH